MKKNKFFCRRCKRYFDDPKVYEERHGLDNPPYEIIAVCPICQDDDFCKFNSFIEKIEVAEKVLPVIMQLNRYSNALRDIFGDGILNSDLSISLEMVTELIVEMFDFLDVDMQRKILKVDNDSDMKMIFMYLEG